MLKMQIIDFSWNNSKNSRSFWMWLSNLSKIFTNLIESPIIGSPIYTNKNSNHPPNVLKQLPKSITKRFSEALSSEYIFNKSIKIYSKTLK